MSDRTTIYAAAFLRSLAAGMVGVLLGIHLAELGFEPAAIGLVVGAGLAGAAVAALVATLTADRLGRRKMLVGLAVAGAAGGAAFAFSSSAALLAGTSFLGMLNGMGRDRGASLIIEQAILPSTTDAVRRTQTFAWYNVLQDAGHALGGLMAAMPFALRALWGVGEIPSFRLALGLYAALILATGFLYLRLSPSVESPGGGGGRNRESDRRGRRIDYAAARGPLSPASRSVILRISSLFALDGLGGGFLTTALLSFFFYRRFGISEGEVGLLFFAARILNALSHLAAAWLAQRIGLVNTMVFTHVPSSLLLMTVAFAPNFAVAAALFLLREGLVEMDVPTRQSYVMAMVRPEERTFASGVTHIVRLAAWAVAPSFAGLFMQGLALGAPLFVGAWMKLAYDGLLYAAFRRVRPPEERQGAS